MGPDAVPQMEGGSTPRAEREPGDKPSSHVAAAVHRTPPPPRVKARVWKTSASEGRAQPAQPEASHAGTAPSPKQAGGSGRPERPERPERSLRPQSAEQRGDAPPKTSYTTDRILRQADAAAASARRNDKLVLTPRGTESAGASTSSTKAQRPTEAHQPERSRQPTSTKEADTASRTTRSERPLANALEPSVYKERFADAPRAEPSRVEAPRGDAIRGEGHRGEAGSTQRAEHGLQRSEPQDSQSSRARETVAPRAPRAQVAQSRVWKARDRAETSSRGGGESLRGEADWDEEAAQTRKDGPGRPPRPPIARQRQVVLKSRSRSPKSLLSSRQASQRPQYEEDWTYRTSDRPRDAPANGDRHGYAEPPDSSLDAVSYSRGDGRGGRARLERVDDWVPQRDSRAREAPRGHGIARQAWQGSTRK